MYAQKPRNSPTPAGISGNAEVGTKSQLQHQNLAQNQNQLRRVTGQDRGESFTNLYSLIVDLYAKDLCELIFVRAIL
jgi:hypothetical protein